MIELDLSARRSKLWLVDAPPLVADACDDEFNSEAAFDAKWTKALSTGASYVSRSVANGRLTLSAIGAGGGVDNMVRWWQPVPASEFVIYAKIGVGGGNTNYTICGLFVGDNLVTGPNTADAHHLEIVWGASLRWYVHRLFTTPTTPAAGTQFTGAMSSAYLRMRVNGTSIGADFSTDGIGWVNISTVTAGFTPVHMGVAFGRIDATIGYGFVDYFRCQRGAGVSAMNATRLGREVALRVAS